MNLIFTIVASLLIGFFVRSRGTAVVSYLIAAGFVFTFQTLDVLLNWMSGADGITGSGAFGPAPDGIPLAYTQSEVYAYGIVNLLIVTLGVGLTLGAHRLARRRASSRGVIAVG